jgi:hypothetical protein
MRASSVESSYAAVMIEPLIEELMDCTRWTYELPLGCWAIITHAHGADHAEMTVGDERGTVCAVITIPPEPGDA